MNYGAGDILEIAPAEGGETLLLPFTKRVAPRIDFAAGRIVIAPPREIEDEALAARAKRMRMVAKGAGGGYTRARAARLIRRPWLGDPARWFWRRAE